MLKKTSNIPSQPSPSWNDGNFYKVVRLRTGELLLCTLSADVKSVASETHLTLMKPVQAVTNGTSTEIEGGGIVFVGYKMKMWQDLCSNDEFIIDTNMVLTIGNMNERIRIAYVEFLNVMVHTEKDIQRKAEHIEREGAIAGLLLRASVNGKYEVVHGDYQMIDGVHTFVSEELDEPKAPTLRKEQGISGSPETTRNSNETGQAE